MIFTSRKLYSRMGAKCARVWSISLLAALTLSCSTAGFCQDQSKTNEAGRRAYSTNCAGCHGLDGKGGERAPDIATRPHVRELSDEGILQVLQRGVANTSMPSFAFLDLKTRRALVAHLRTLQGATVAAKLPGDALRGREIFFGKGTCGSCHMARGQGGFFATDLSNYAQGRSPESIREAIVAPNRELDPRRRTVVVTLSNRTTIEGIARNEDNFSIQLISQDGAIHLLQKSSLTKLAYRDQSPMPADYGERLSSAELDDLVNFLSSLPEKRPNSKIKNNDEDE
jgi:putative heme-binding domain-containing protein